MNDAPVKEFSDAVGRELVVGSTAEGDEQRRILDLVSQTTFGPALRGCAGGAGEARRALRKAFMETMQDADLKTEAKRMDVDIMPVAGQARSPGRSRRRGPDRKSQGRRWWRDSAPTHVLREALKNLFTI
jgi:hypothetical protein